MPQIEARVAELYRVSYEKVLALVVLIKSTLPSLGNHILTNQCLGSLRTFSHLLYHKQVRLWYSLL